MESIVVQYIIISAQLQKLKASDDNAFVYVFAEQIPTASAAADVF